MKKLVILFLSVGLIAGCNNSNPFVRKDSTTKNAGKEKDDKEEKKRNSDHNDGISKNDDYAGKDNSGSNWTRSDRDKWMNKCQDLISDNPKAMQICSCVLDKVEHKYPDIKDAEESTEEEGQRIIQDCTTNMNGEDKYVNPDGNRDNTDDLYKEQTNSAGSWTRMQREQYIQGCETTARRTNQGYTAQQVYSYCECMTRKVEQKYSFQQAARMTAADFQTREWQNAAADCTPHY